MKNLNLLRFAAVFSIFALLVSSCTKDSISRNQIPGQSSNQNTTNDPGPIVNTGVIQATLHSSSTTTTSLWVYDENGFTSGEVFADEQGIVRFTGLAAGNYTAVARAYIYDGTDDLNPTIVTITIPDIQVTGDQVSDLGLINFD